MGMQLRNACVQIDLSAYSRNIRTLRAFIGHDVQLIAVVKGNAYGHGLIPATRAAVCSGADWLGVALAEEGLALREAGIKQPILIHSGINQAGFYAAAVHGLTATVFDENSAIAANAAGISAGRMVDIHVKIDTGMGRIGVRSQEALNKLLRRIAHSPGVRLTGAYSHFADADNPDPAYTDAQLARFLSATKELPEGLLVHAAASAAALSRRDTHLDMVRIGIASYGYPPVPTTLPLEKCLRLSTEVTQVKDIEPGCYVGYGRTYRADRNLRIATLAIGYGDGYARALSSRGKVLIRGVPCPVLGRICMDQTMVDVSHVPDVRTGDIAVLLGRQDGQEIDANDIAAWRGTIAYEVLLSPTPRLPVIYMEEQ